MKRVFSALFALLFACAIHAQGVPNFGSLGVPNGGPGGGGGGGSGTVTQVATACGTSGGPITTTGTISASLTSRTVTGATDTILSTDCGNIVYYNSASAIAITQPVPSGSFAAGFFTTVCNINTGVPTITPGSGTIGGAPTKAIDGGKASAPSCFTYQSDGTNFNIVSSGSANTVASGTAALGTSAVSAGACGSATTVSAPGVVTTDTIQVGFNGDPTATTGYTPAAMLTIVPYPTAGNVNFKQCNLTGSSITPSALTVNWRVAR